MSDEDDIDHSALAGLVSLSATRAAASSMVRQWLVDAPHHIAGLGVFDVLEVPIASVVDDTLDPMPPARLAEELVTLLDRDEPTPDRRLRLRRQDRTKLYPRRQSQRDPALDRAAPRARLRGADRLAYGTSQQEPARSACHLSARLLPHAGLFIPYALVWCRPPSNLDALGG